MHVHAPDEVRQLSTVGNSGLYCISDITERYFFGTSRHSVSDYTMLVTSHVPRRVLRSSLLKEPNRIGI